MNQPRKVSSVSLVWPTWGASAAQEPTTTSLDRRPGTTPRWPSAPGRRRSGANGSENASASESENVNRAADMGELAVVGEGVVVDDGGSGSETEVGFEVEVEVVGLVFAAAAASGFRGFPGFPGFPDFPGSRWQMNGRTGSAPCYCVTAARGVAAGVAWGGSRGQSAEEEGSTPGGGHGVVAGSGNTGSPSPGAAAARGSPSPLLPALSLPRAGALESPSGREPPWRISGTAWLF